MRRAARVDDNHSEVTAALRAVGCSVQSLAQLGKGCPDILVGTRERDNLLMEIKDGSKPPSARKLTPDEERWAKRWNTPVYIVTSVAEALALVGVTITGEA